MSRGTLRVGDRFVFVCEVPTFLISYPLHTYSEGRHVSSRSTVLEFIVPYLIIYFGMAILFGAFKDLAGKSIAGGLTMGLAYALTMFPITWGTVLLYTYVKNKE